MIFLALLTGFILGYLFGGHRERGKHQGVFVPPPSEVSLGQWIDERGTEVAISEIVDGNAVSSGWMVNVDPVETFKKAESIDDLLV